MDAASQDGTRRRSRTRAGADVRQDARELLPEFGQAARQGRRDVARALGRRAATLVVYLDSDTRRLLGEHFATGLLRPADLPSRDVRFVKGALTADRYAAVRARRAWRRRRPRDRADRAAAAVAFYPELAAVPPAAGGRDRGAARVLSRIPFATGYAIETSMLLHVCATAGGIERMAAGRPRAAPQPPPAARRADADGRHRAPAVIPERCAAEGRLIDDTSTLLLDPSNGAPSRRTPRWSSVRRT